MKQPMLLSPRHRGAALVAAALVGLGVGQADAQVTDISQTPLASASNLSVLPNLMFLLDDSGSMRFDALPDHTERSQTGSERRYLHTLGTCKPKGALTTSTDSYLNNLPTTHCDRTDPPFGATQFNGMYYNPQVTYRPPINYDGTSYAKMDSSKWTSVPCDPFPSSTDCKDWYGSNQSFYDNGRFDVEEIPGDRQSYDNPSVKQWYGTSSDFDVQNKWPEIVYCNSSGGDVNNLDQCRRNGLTNSGSETRHTGTPFRYTTARWGRGNTYASTPAGVAQSGGYPESAPIHEFWRPATGNTVTVTMAYPHGRASGSTLEIIPRTGTGTTGSGLDCGTSSPCNSTGTVTVTVPAATATNNPAYQFTYSNGRTGQRLAYGQFDLVVDIARSSSVITISKAWNHGLNVGDKIDVTEVSCASGTCSFSVTGAQITSVVDAHTFRYSQGSGTKSGKAYYRKTNLFTYPKLRAGNPHYYTIEPVEYCKDIALTDCTLATAATGAYIYPAPVRYCISPFDAYRLDAASGKEPTNTKARCRKKYEEATGYTYVRYGQFQRGDITTAGSYASRPLRSDCTSRPTCSGSEEMTNFANWFAYYRTRMLTMKSAAGVAFAPIDSRYRVGFLTINPDNPVDSNKYLKIDTFTPSHKQKWYDMFYKQDPGGTTPLPEALSRVGRHFAGVKSGINDDMDDDPVQYSCQQNFVLMTTDGYWNDRDGVDETNKSIGNVDNNSSTTPRPMYDGGTPFNPNPSDSENSSSGTLADIAQYFYQTDLRKSGATGALGTDVSENNVPTSEKDKANWQHMVTFGLGMAEGLMDWRQDYESPDATGDFDNVRKGALNACSWATGACNWPMPGSRKPGNLDDLWHAAVNGRGKFFYANDTRSVQDGLNTALTNLNERNASGAAAATSTPNITPSDRGIFKTSYTTVQWNGEILAQLIDPNDGSVLPGILWSAKDKLQSLVGPDTDTRTIHLGRYDVAGGVKPFKYSDLDPTEKTWFDNKCNPVSTMTQCALLDPVTQLPLANSGTNMVNFLRGQTQFEKTGIYRDRLFALGDTVNAVPLYVSKPRFAFSDKVSLPYLDWAAQSSVKNRTATLYVAANDGMLHAFNAGTGDELWAFIPRQVAPGMWKLAEDNYATKHQYFVDGSPASMDVWDGSTWRTILVGGLNAGGRGFYALDITDPAAPTALWEFCHDATLCSESDPNIGYSFGNPVIAKRESDGKWVVLVTSGYNNVSPGDGKGYLYILDALTGKKDKTLTTGVGTSAKPSGLGRISAWTDNYTVDNSAKWVYGGDQEGNLWRFTLTDDDSSDPVHSVLLLGQTIDGNNKPQPITTRPELGLVDATYKAVFVGTGRYLGVKDLSDPATQTPAGSSAWQQSVYAFKDQGKPLGNLRSAANKLVQQTITELSGGIERTVTQNKVDWTTQNGWYVDLNPGNKSPGERVNVDPQLALGTLLVTTNVPGASACSIGGDSWVYQFDYRSGSYVQGAPNNLVARKQTGALTVGMVVYQLQKGSIVGQVQRSETSMRKEDINIAPGSTPSRRTSWREITPDLQ